MTTTSTASFFPEDERTISFAIDSYGTFVLLVLIGNDYAWLSDEHVHSLPPRAFVVQLIQNHLLEPALSPETISAWPDEQLQIVAVKWWNEQEELQHEERLSDDATLESVKVALLHYYDAHIRPLRTSIQSAADSYNNLAASVLGINSIVASVSRINNLFMPSPGFMSAISHIGSMSESYSALFRQSQETLQFFEQSLKSANLITNIIQPQLNWLERLSPHILQSTAFFQALPDLNEVAVELGEIEESEVLSLQEGASEDLIEQAQATFKVTRYGFMSRLLTNAELLEFASYPDGTREEEITNKLIEKTNDERFMKVFIGLVEESQVLRRRLSVIREAFAVHQEKRYLLSIPILLAQVEGMIGDALILKGDVGEQENKLYRRDENGQFKLKQNGKPNRSDEITGLGGLIRTSKWATHPILDGVAALIQQKLGGDRNIILHGREVEYGEPHLSVQSLLLLRLLAEQICAFERGEVRL
ncbi:hypothetical protein [Ktedonobacter robiniae]|uniref:Uncharacterized protein n=1 Tax=Ktedonobacter robiniae TaxID=2778365 RepID=A0ABQ3V249_9CHLR|nr:hypothetical protein [Ktedonobacter robiniae]GHO59231.1 hypothetical protein KSB_77060 [Ktedonobacter robiniae]